MDVFDKLELILIAVGITVLYVESTRIGKLWKTIKNFRR